MLGLVPVAVANGQRVAGAQLPVETARHIVANTRIGKCDSVVGRSDVGAGTVLENRDRDEPGIHVVEVAALGAEKERCLLVDGAAQASIELVAVVARNFGREGIAGVEYAVIALEEELTVQLVGSGLGEDFDAAVAEAIVLCRKWILVDTDFANRRFRRKLSAGKTVDEDLAAVGSGGRTGESLQFAGEFVGIVGEGIEVLALEDDGVGVAGGFDAHGGRLVGDHYVLLLRLNGHGDVDALGLARGDGQRLGLKGSEAAVFGADNDSCRERGRALRKRRLHRR